MTPKGDTLLQEGAALQEGPGGPGPVRTGDQSLWAT